MSRYFSSIKKISDYLAPTALGILALWSANVNAAPTEVNLTDSFKTGKTSVVMEINDFPEQVDNATFNLAIFSRNGLNNLYADSRLNTQNNKPVFTAFDQDPTAPNQQKLTYLNLQAALDTMLYGDDPKRKQVHLAALKKQPAGSNDNQVNGFGTQVAVIDSGINTRQPDFTNSVQVHDLGGQKYANEITHGTEVALTAGGANGKFQGVAPGSKIHAYAIDPENIVLEDVFYTVYRDKVSVVNASFVIGDDLSILPSIRDTFYKIFKDPNAPIYVFAAGNKDEPDSKFSNLLKKLVEDNNIMRRTLVVSGVKIKNPKLPPAANNIEYDPDAISCSEVKYNCLTAFFAYDVPNPKSTGATKDYVTSYGTSFAAPQVSGGAALVKQMFPWFDADNIRQTLLTTATDIGQPGIDDSTGWGLLNVGAAIKGPAQFAFGDFVADLTNDKVSGKRDAFWFKNNIFGQYGLVVKDNSEAQRTLILSGNNTFKGNTTVQSGILRLEGSVTSSINIDHDGLFQLAATGKSGNVYNNGFFVSFGGIVNGNLVNTRNSITTSTLASPMTINGEAKLGGSLVIEIPKDVKVEKGKAYLIMKAKKLTGEFHNLAVEGPYKASIFYDTASGQVAVKLD